MNSTNRIITSLTKLLAVFGAVASVSETSSPSNLIKIPPQPSKGKVAPALHDLAADTYDRVYAYEAHSKALGDAIKKLQEEQEDVQATLARLHYIANKLTDLAGE